MQSAGFSQSGCIFISVNQVLAFARAGKDYLLCFIPVQLYFIPLPGNLYLASRDVGKSCISLLATVQVIMVMPPRAQGRSTRRSSPPFIFFFFFSSFIYLFIYLFIYFLLTEIFITTISLTTLSQQNLRLQKITIKN